MKILIIGDYSSFGKNLKEAFEKLGYFTCLVTNGDAWKKIDVEDLKDLKIEEIYHNIKILGKTIKGTALILNFFRRVLKFLGYNSLKCWIKKNKLSFDIVIIMNQEFITRNNFTGVISCNRYFFTMKEVDAMLKKNGKKYMLACGDDSYYLNYADKYKYWPYDGGYPSKKYLNKFDKADYNNILKKMDGIIPTCYDYAKPYRDNEFIENLGILKETIQFPINLDKIEYIPNEVKGKIIIFHGLNREEFKGTAFIKDAMENIQRKYPSKVQIIIDGNMSFEKYKKILEKTNIIIDQCKSYSYGMNALIGMAQGKLVFSGNEIECMNELQRKDIPIVNILPSVKDIEEKLEYYINNPELIVKMGKKSREFVEDFHESSIVAKKYLKIMECE